MTPNHHNQALADAFEAFTQMSAQLESSYRELELRVADLNGELAAARSERVQQLVEKERLADRLQTLLSALPAAVLVLDGAERVRECNRVAQDLLGQPLVGETWDAVCTRVFADSSHQTHELLLQDGRRFSIASRTLDNEPGRILVLQDISETCALQEISNRQKRLGAMGEMAASLAHQIRTPLSAAVLYCAHLAKDHLPSGDRARFAGRLSERLRHLECLVNDMLAFARGGRGGEEIIVIDELLSALHASVETQLNNAGAIWKLNNQVGAARLRGNRDALLGALTNLVTNSLQVNGSDAPRIDVTARKTIDGELEIRVRDNGPGIPANLRERIFEPFYTTRPGGTGLGLAVVQATLRAHHGRIYVESPADGGAEFVLQLPEARMLSAMSTNDTHNYLADAAPVVTLRSRA